MCKLCFEQTHSIHHSILQTHHNHSSILVSCSKQMCDDPIILITCATSSPSPLVYNKTETYSMKLAHPPATQFSNANTNYTFTLNSTMLSNVMRVRCLYQTNQSSFQHLSPITNHQNTLVSCSLNNRPSFPGNTDFTLVTLVAMTSNTSYIVICVNNYTIVHFPGKTNSNRSMIIDTTHHVSSHL